MDWDFETLPVASRYKLLVGLVTPRPIAFVSTRGRDGVDNAAPFSFFNVLAEDPPVVIVSIERRPDGRSKDSGRNILETGEFVVNMVDEDLLERMHLCSVEFPSEVSEFAQAGLTAAPARSLSPQTCAAVKATNRPKMMPSTGSMPGEIAFSDFARSSVATSATKANTVAARR